MTQTPFEKAVTASLFVGLMLLGWGMFWWNGWREPYAFPPLIFVCAAMTVLSAGLLLDCAGFFTLEGKGIYSLAVFVSLPVTGTVAAGASTFAANAALLIVSGAFWLISKASGDNRPYLLGMYFLLCGVTGVVLGSQAAALAVVIPLIMRNDEHRESWKLVMAAIAAVLIGIGAGYWGGFPHHEPGAVDVSKALTRLQNLLPWAGWLLPLAILGDKVSTRLANAVAILLLLITAVSGLSMTVTAVAISPALSMIIAGFFVHRFALGAGRNRRDYLMMQGAVSASLILLCLTVNWGDAHAIPLVVLVSMLLILAAILQRIRQLRWAFPLWIISGLLVGVVTLDTLQFGGISRQTAITGTAVMVSLGLAGFIVFRVYYGVKPTYPADDRTDLHEYGGGVFRAYRYQVWSGATVELAKHGNGSFRFFVFGDVAGADSIISTRQGGYFGFKRLIERVEKDAPDFCISLGDLASSANELPYRRVRKMLAQIAAPIIATPGNHDLYDGAIYDTRLFRGLFGADNCSFQLGQAQFVLLNNAVGNVTDEQFAWITRELVSTKCPIKLCFAHKPVFDLREGGNYAMEWRPHAEQLHELFQRSGVRAVFSGHIHSFLSETRDGVLYIISGGGGSKKVSGGVPHHFLDCECSEAGVAIRAVSLEAQATVFFERLITRVL